MISTHPTLFVLGLSVSIVAALIGWRCLVVLRKVSWFKKPATVESHSELISVIIPARNEAIGLKPALASVLAQQGVELEVILVDDHSTDATGAIAETLADRDRRLRVIHHPPMAAGWLGKQNAMQYAAQQARGDYLVFTDADIVHDPMCFAAALSDMKREKRDFLSLLPRMDFETIFENAHLPNVTGFFAFFMSTKDARSDRHIPVAAGAFMLLRRELFESLGGFASIRAEILDDVELARLIKKAGHAVHYHFAPDLLRVRMFKGNREAFWGATKNILSATGGRPWLGLPIMFFPWLVFGVPWVCLAVGWQDRNPALAGLGFLAYALQYLMLLPCSRFIELRPVRLLCFPLVALMDCCCILRALYYHYVKGSVLWRDRAIKLTGH